MNEHTRVKILEVHMLHDLTIKQYKWIKTHIYYYKTSHVCKYRNTSSYQNNILTQTTNFTPKFVQFFS